MATSTSVKQFSIVDWTLKHWTQLTVIVGLIASGSLFAVDLKNQVKEQSKEIASFKEIIAKQHEISKDISELKVQTTRQDEQLKSIKDSQQKSEQYLERLIVLNERKK
jgi:Tfp pilus assembly protein PilN